MPLPKNAKGSLTESLAKSHTPPAPGRANPESGRFKALSGDQPDPAGIRPAVPLVGAAIASEPVLVPPVASKDGTREFETARFLDNPLNSRRVYRDADVKLISESLLARGQLVPLRVYLNDEGEPVVIAGGTRVRGARLAGIKTLRAEVVPRPTDREIYLQSREDNKARNEETAVDHALAWRHLLEEKVFETQQELALAQGVGESIMSQTLQIALLPKDLLVFCQDHPNLSTQRALYALYRFNERAGPEETMALAAEAASKGLSAKEIDRRLQNYGNVIKRPRANQYQVDFQGVKGEIREVAPKGTIQMTFTGLDATQRVEMLDKIRSMFGVVSS
jgi:ParB/RepB/Spo0J family partition protein